MGTRSNILIIKKDSDNKFIVTQYYHHFDGYLEGVGEEMRLSAVTALGLSTITNEALSESLDRIMSSDPSYEREENFAPSDLDDLHGDIEYLYILDLAKYSCDDVISMYYIGFGWDWSKNFKNIEEILKHICTEEHKINLAKSLREKDK